MLVEKIIWGSRMLLDTDDPGLSADLWREGTREWDCPHVTHQIVTEGQVCIDIGANLGYYALMEAKLVRHFGHVYAIEPVQKSVDILNASAELNGYQNISTYCMAIGAENGTARFTVRAHSNLCRLETTKARPVLGWAREVPIMTLDSFVEQEGIERIDYLRYDIESAEVELVAGAQKTLAGMPVGSYMFGEWHTVHFENPVEDMQPALQNVLDHGFVPRRCIPVTPLEEVPVEEFAFEVCTTYAKAAPRIFFEKVR